MMGELHVEPPTEATSEEKTEPFSQNEVEARMRSFRERQESHAAAVEGDLAVHLDDLVVPQDKDIRILVNPLTRSRSVSPGSHDCEWLQLTAEVADKKQPEHKVLAVTQTSRDIKFSVRIPGESSEDETRPELWCELYYDPASDNQIFINRSYFPAELSRVSQVASPGLDYVVNPGVTKGLIPGTWRIKVTGINVLDFRIIEKRPTMLRVPSASSSTSTLSDMANSSGKRSLAAGEDGLPGSDKRLRATDSAARTDDGVVMFMRPGNAANPLIFPLPTGNKGKEIMGASGNALLDMREGDEVEVPGGEVDTYTIKKLGQIASTSLSSVSRAEYSKEPDSIITIKVLKTRLGQRALAAARPQEAERSVIRQADTWMREFLNHEELQHPSIPRLFGGDARHLSLYMEYIDAKDLAERGVWQNHKTTTFMGTRDDALRILRDVSGALDYIHSRNLVHNDIKPGNIMYSRGRGAVLCDYGLSTTANHKHDSIGGTPFYICPEFITQKLRGPPSDVWALGITMLYVLRIIGLPDARGLKNHPRQLYWTIAYLHLRLEDERQKPNFDGRPASLKMQQWLREINEAKRRLDLGDALEKLVSDMLITQPSQRITMRKVVAELSRIPSPEQDADV